jgi:hypothetical protein
MAGWQEVLKIIGMLALIFFLGGWLIPKMNLYFS